MNLYCAPVKFSVQPDCRPPARYFPRNITVNPDGLQYRRQIEYKSEWNHIQVIIADRFFPSSKLCSCCGSMKKDLKLSDRIYKCECGNVIDRDYQAALNLKKYGEMFLKQQSVA